MKRTNTATWNEKRGHWRINVQKNNIRKTFYSSTPGRTGQRECHAKADAWLDDGIESTTLKIGKAADEYLENLKLTASRTHYTKTEYYIRLYVKPRIGNVRLSDLNEQHIQSVIDYGFSKKLYKKTLMGLRSTIFAFLKFCRKSKYTTLRPEEIVIPNGAQVKERTILQPDDLRKVFTVDTKITRGKPKFEEFIHAFRFEVSTGMRPGEILGLRWSDINGGQVSLRRAINTYGEQTTGKNDNARRAFTLNEISSAVLDAQREYQRSLGIESEWVFTGNKGEQPREGRYYRHWIAYCEDNGIVKTSAYEMRHTFVSVVKSLPEGYLKQLVGHSKSMDTYGVYSHELDEDSKNAAELVSGIFGKLLMLSPKKDESDAV